MIGNLSRLVGVAATLLVGAAAMAAPVVIFERNPDVSDGPGSASRADTSTGPLSVTAANAAFIGYSITRIQWWGFDVSTPTNNEFSLLVGSTPVLNLAAANVVGSVPFPAPDDNLSLVQYSADLNGALIFGASNTISLMNTSASAEWYWQNAAGTNSQRAFRIFGEAPAAGVPEPGSAWLGALAALGLLAARRRA